MAFTFSRTKCSGFYRSSSSTIAPSSSGFGNPFLPVTPVKLRGQSFPSAPSQNGPSLVDDPRRCVEISENNGACSRRKKYCMCSPSTHATSFRCSLHRNVKKSGDDQQLSDQPSFFRSSDVGLNLRRMTLANSLLKINAAEGRNLLRRASSPPQQKLRRVTFPSRPSRLSRMSNGSD